MLRRTFLAVIVYVVGAIALFYWSITGFIEGAPREDWALMLVLPTAWIISFWPLLGSFVMMYKVFSIQGVLGRFDDRIDAFGVADTNDLQELEDVATRMVSEENRIPKFIVRPLVRKTIARLAERPNANAE